jgi:hypothetical protein
VFKKNQKKKIMRNPTEVKHAGLPYKLVFYSHESAHDQDYLFHLYNKIKKKKEFFIVMNCTVNIEKDLLNSVNDKRLLAYGTFKHTFDLPELEFIEKHGSILEIHEINIYDTKVRNRRIINEARKNMRCMICKRPLYPYSDLRPSHH